MYEEQKRKERNGDLNMETQIREKFYELKRIEIKIFEIYKELRELESKEIGSLDELSNLYKTERLCLELLEKFVEG